MKRLVGAAVLALFAVALGCTWGAVIAECVLPATLDTGLEQQLVRTDAAAVALTGGAQ